MSALGSALAPRNFTVTLDERVRGLAGPPSYAVRKRRIEDLENELITALRALPVLPPGSTSAWEDLVTTAMKSRFAALSSLVDAHNRFFPVEANLPMDVTTGATIDRSGSWPHRGATWAELYARSLFVAGDEDD